jgi:hypothetical protein
MLFIVKRHILLALAVVLALTPARSQTAGRIRGSVVDTSGGEALANVKVQLTGSSLRAISDATGHFHIDAIPPGDYTLNVSTVGYHLANRSFHLDPGETKEFEVLLTPDSLRQTDTVEARTDPFESSRQDSPSTLVMAGNDVKNLGSVLADDPLRAVQSLPGVTSNNDFDARFSLRGADYDRIGLYLDDVLLHEPFHELQGVTVSGSGTAFNGDMVEMMELDEGAYPARFGDRSAGVLNVETREGNRDDFTFRVAASASNAGVMAEGPFSKKKKRGSWLVATRKSYLQYILERTFPNTSLIFGLEDVQARLSYDLTSKSSLSLYLLESYSDLDRTRDRSQLGINSVMDGGYHYTLANLGWHATPTNTLIVSSHAAWMREKWNDTDPNSLSLGQGFYGEWVWNANATWMWNNRAPLDIGWSTRELRDEGYSNQYQSTTSKPTILDHFNGDSTRVGGYAQQSFLAWKGRLHLEAGARWDHDSIDRVAAVSPQASASLMVTSYTRVQLGFGQYTQYPEISVLTSPLGARGMLPQRSNQAIAAVEQRIGSRTRLRAELYNRADRDLIFQPLYDPRLLTTGKVFAPPLNPPYTNSLRGYSRGAEFFLQRSSANRLTGWVSYAYGHAEDRDGVLGNRFPSDYDQRHTVNVYGSYRLKPTVNMSLRWSYGSAFPIPGYLQQIGSNYYLTTVRNQLRLPAYERTDYRINKAWAHDKWKMTLYGEVINLTNRTNYIFDSFNGYTSSTHQAYITLDKMFPILPSAGLVFER